MKELQITDFYNEVISSFSPVILTISADWCGPCHILHSIFEEMEEFYGEKIKFFEINVIENANVCADLEIKYIPTTIIYYEGKELKRIVGVPEKDELSGEIASLIFQESKNS